MRPLSVVVAQSDAKTADFLAKSLYNHFRVVNTAGNLKELMHSIPKHRADVAIVDLELAGLEEVQQLRSQFADTTIVCTHRLADERMWTDALAAGASDCCHSSDVRAIVLAATNLKPLSHSHAA
ncbi:MAG TPA: response regulator [Candidatus Angelobacter sp.]|nr:response regulator [Candidatus Angelobacter sp.]